ncbi:uncharacterized protein LOC141850535 [Brevipalpus obovatus]|uniref:uncharacterized protein LOC141850535 n=1 Tax=Brevipalpus obovatus TaxID=246614 RepID=UPI003D9F4D85
MIVLPLLRVVCVLFSFSSLLLMIIFLSTINSFPLGSLTKSSSSQLSSRSSKTGAEVIVIDSNNPNNNQVVSQSKRTKNGHTIIVIGGTSPTSPQTTSSSSSSLPASSSSRDLTNMGKSSSMLVQRYTDRPNVWGLDYWNLGMEKIKPPITCMGDSGCMTKDNMPKFFPFMVPYHKASRGSKSSSPSSSHLGNMGSPSSLPLAGSENYESKASAPKQPQIIIRKSKDSPPIIIEEVKDNGNRFMNYHFTTNYDSTENPQPPSQLESPLILNNDHLESAGFVASLPISMTMSSGNGSDASNHHQLQQQQQQQQHLITRHLSSSRNTLAHPVFVPNSIKSVISSSSTSPLSSETFTVMGESGSSDFGPLQMESLSVNGNDKNIENLNTAEIPEVDLSSLPGQRHLNNLMEQEGIQRIGIGEFVNTASHDSMDLQALNRDELMATDVSSSSNQFRLPNIFDHRANIMNALMPPSFFQDYKRSMGMLPKSDRNRFMAKWFASYSDSDRQASVELYP